MRDKGAAVGPMCLQFGQVIRVSIETCSYRHGGGCKGLKSAQQLRQFSDLGADAQALSLN